jgi:hypothetical protein
MFIMICGKLGFKFSVVHICWDNFCFLMVYPPYCSRIGSFFHLRVFYPQDCESYTVLSTTYPHRFTCFLYITDSFIDV